MWNNTTQSEGNITDGFKLQAEEEKGLYGFLSLMPSCIFLYVNGVMLYTLRSKPVFRETPRYIMLYNLLFADTIQLVISQLLYILALARAPMLRSVCGIMTAFGILTADTSSLTLAVMSLERYVAVCFPLRHTTIVTIRGTGVAIAVVWAICSANTLIRFIILFILDSTPINQLMPDFCSKEILFRLQIFSVFDEGFTCLVFVSVGVIIIFSYIGVMVAARSASSDKASTTKARKTVLLHLIQLCLSLSTTLTSTILIGVARSGANRETLIRLRNILFILLVILPRCLSPLIYGLRDQTIRPILLYHLSFNLRDLHRTRVMPSKCK